jgi:hypothetical protein
MRSCLCLVLVALPTVSCRKAAHLPVAASQQQTKPQAAQDQVLDPEEQSCRAFVQSFYDWYWNQFADKAEDPSFSGKIHGYDDVLRLEPPVLSQELAKLIEKTRQSRRRQAAISSIWTSIPS